MEKLRRARRRLSIRRDVPGARRPPGAPLRAPAGAAQTVHVYAHEAQNTFDEAPILSVLRAPSVQHGHWMHAVVARSIAVCRGTLKTPTTSWVHKVHERWQAARLAAASVADRHAGRVQRTLRWYGGQGARIWNDLRSFIYVMVFVPIAGKVYSAEARRLIRLGAKKSLYVGHAYQTSGKRLLRHFNCADDGVDVRTGARHAYETTFYNHMRVLGAYDFVLLPLERVVTHPDFILRSDSGFRDYTEATPTLLARERFWMLRLVSFAGDRSLKVRVKRPRLAAVGSNMYLVGGRSRRAAAPPRAPPAAVAGPARLRVLPAHAIASSFSNVSSVDVHLRRRYISHDYNYAAVELTRRFARFKGAVPLHRLRAILEAQNWHRLTSIFWWILQGDAATQQRFSFAVTALQTFFVLKFQPRRLVRDNVLSISIPFVDKGIDALGLPHFITAAAEELLPDTAKLACGLPRVVYRYGVTQGHALLDLHRSSIACRKKSLAKLKLLCKCSSIDHDHCQPNKYFDEPHMASTDFTVFRCRELTDMLGRGTNFRSAGIYLDGDEDDKPVGTLVADSIKASIEDYCAAVCATTRLKPKTMKPFFRKALSDVRAALADFEPDDDVSSLSRRARRKLAEVQRRFFLMPCDKAPDRFCYVCKLAYASAAWKFLEGSRDTFDPVVGRSALVVADSIIRFVDAAGVASKLKPAAELPNDGVATLYFTLKFFKLPTALRPICGGVNLALTPLSKCLAAALNLAMTVTDRCWRDTLMTELGLVIDRSPILLGCEEFGQHLGLINRLMGQGVVDFDGVSVKVRDVKSMYTLLPQDMIIEEVQDLVDHIYRRERTRLDARRTGAECFMYVPMASRVGRDAAFFSMLQVLDEPMRKYYIRVDNTTLKAWMRFVVSHCFFTFGGVLFHQRVGLPMGDNASVAFANLTLFSLEYKFLLRLARRHAAAAVGPPRTELRNTIISVALSTRLVDDRFDFAVGGLDSSTWLYSDHTVDGLYPRFFRGITLPIELEDVGLNGHEVNYLDFTVWKDPKARRLAFRLFDKRRVGQRAVFFKDYRTFPHPESALSRSCQHGVVSSQIIRFSRRCSRMRDFVREASDFLIKFGGAGYSKRMAYMKFLRVVTGSQWNKTLGKPQTAVRKVRAELAPFFRRR